MLQYSFTHFVEICEPECSVTKKKSLLLLFFMHSSGQNKLTNVHTDCFREAEKEGFK